MKHFNFKLLPKFVKNKKNCKLRCCSEVYKLCIAFPKDVARVSQGSRAGIEKKKN